MRITYTKKSKHKTKKCEWVALYSEVQKLVPDNQEFGEEYHKLTQILEVVQNMKRDELNEFADSLASKAEYQKLYRDGRWLDSPENYNTKTQVLIDAIYEDLLLYRLGKSVAKAFKKGAKHDN